MRTTESTLNSNESAITNYLNQSGIIKAFENQIKAEKENTSIPIKEYKLDLQADLLIKALAIFDTLKIKYSVNEVSSENTCSATLYYSDGIGGRFLMNAILIKINELVKENLLDCASNSFIDLLKVIESQIKPIKTK